VSSADSLQCANEFIGMSSLDPKDAIADYSSLTEAQVKTLDQWEAFFEKVGSVARSLMGMLTI